MQRGIGQTRPKRHSLVIDHLAISSTSFVRAGDHGGVDEDICWTDKVLHRSCHLLLDLRKVDPVGYLVVDASFPELKYELMRIKISQRRYSESWWVGVRVCCYCCCHYYNDYENYDDYNDYYDYCYYHHITTIISISFLYLELIFILLAAFVPAARFLGLVRCRLDIGCCKWKCQWFSVAEDARILVKGRWSRKGRNSCLLLLVRMFKRIEYSYRICVVKTGLTIERCGPVDA